MRFKVTIAYDGSNFSGFQRQPNQRTVQGEIEQALYKMTKSYPITIHASGRTDAGVHAHGQVFHFDWPLEEIGEQNVLEALNVLTADDLVVQSVERVADNFHARFHARSKIYTYHVLNQSLSNPFLRSYVYHHPYALDREKLEQCLDLIIGEHDFSSFCSARSDKQNKTRTIYRADLDVNSDRNIWSFTFEGNGFLYNMLRILMGTLIEVGDGRKTVADFKEIFEAKDRTKAGKTLSPSGLYLEKVNYEGESDHE